MQKHLVWLVSVLLVACTLPNMTGSQSTPVPPTTAPVATAVPISIAVAPITWGKCDDDAVSAEDRATYECGKVTVPLDYAAPDGKTIDIALIRIPATTTRQGAILYNPGGPGASGFEYVAKAGQRYINDLGLDAFDFVGFDPRGVDRSQGVRCQSDADMDKYMYPDSTPDTPEEKVFLTEAEHAFAKACKAKYGDDLQYYSTVNTAHDMDMIRLALGDTQISYLGVSYGTYLGAVYATLFPDNLRAMILDSAYEPTGDSIEEQYLTQLQGFALAMNNWIKWCQTEQTCAFQTADVGARWDALYAQYDANPVTAADGRVANQLVIERATISALYSKSQWATLGFALANAEKGDASGVWKLADAYYQRDTDGTYTSMQQSNSVIDCASGLSYDAVTTDAAGLLQKMTTTSPHFTKDTTVEDLQKPADCMEYMPDVQPPTLGYQGNAPILVVAGENDPATPLRWGTKMRDAMGKTARLVTFSGEGHGQVLSASCVNNYARDLLVELTLPAADAKCDPDPAVQQPAWWHEIPQISNAQELNQELAMSSLGFTDSEVYLQAWAVDNDDASALLNTYGAEFEKMGYLKSGAARDITGAKLQYFVSGENYVGMLVLDSATLASDDWSSLQLITPAGKAVVLYLYFPG